MHVLRKMAKRMEARFYFDGANCPQSLSGPEWFHRAGLGREESRPSIFVPFVVQIAHRKASRSFTVKSGFRQPGRSPYTVLFPRGLGQAEACPSSCFSFVPFVSFVVQIAPRKGMKEGVDRPYFYKSNTCARRPVG